MRSLVKLFHFTVSGLVSHKELCQVKGYAFNGVSKDIKLPAQNLFVMPLQMLHVEQERQPGIGDIFIWEKLVKKDC